MTCPARDTDEVGWVCFRPDGHEGPHLPKLSEEAKAFILESECLNEALFDLGNVFQVPLTNNIPWLDKKTGEPIYDVGEFIDMVRAVANKFKEEL